MKILKKFSTQFYQFIAIIIITLYFMIYSINEFQDSKERFINSQENVQSSKNFKIFCMILTQPKNLKTKVSDKHLKCL